MPKKLEKDEVAIEMIEGPEGPCLAVMLPEGVGGTRIAGPKPWGGGRTTRTWRVKRSALLEAIGEKSRQALETAVAELAGYDEDPTDPENIDKVRDFLEYARSLVAA